MKKKPAGHSPKATAAAVEARVAAQRTPTTVRRALLHSGPQTIGGVTIQPFSLLIIWLLEEVASPVIGAPSANGGEMSTADLALAVAIFAEPDRAAVIADNAPAGVSPASALRPLAREVAGRVAVQELKAIGERIGEIIRANLAPGPGGDGGDPTRHPTPTAA
jgi:hypothetical protein